MDFFFIVIEAHSENRIILIFGVIEKPTSGFFLGFASWKGAFLFLSAILGCFSRGKTSLYGFLSIADPAPDRKKNKFYVFSCF